MSEATKYPRAEVEARFRRPKVLQVPGSEYEIFRIRLEWDDPVHVEELLEVEIPMLDGALCRCTARVARVDPVVWKEPTRYEVFLELFDLDEDTTAALRELLEPEPEALDLTVGGTGQYVLQGPFHDGTSFRRPRRDDPVKV